jgi:hypothetical protein
LQGRKAPASFHKRLEGDYSLELYETLLATQGQLRDFSEREINP